MPSQSGGVDQKTEWRSRFTQFWLSGKPSGGPPAFLACWLGEAVFALVERLEGSLLSRTKRPVWTRTPTGGVLMYDGEVVRTIVGVNRSRNVIEILDRFETMGWPPSIRYPFDDAPRYKVSDDLHNPLKTLRKGLTRLYFGGDESGNGVYWEVRHD